MTKDPYLKYRDEKYEKQITIKMTPKMFNWIQKESKEYEIPIAVVIRSLINIGIQRIELK